MATIKQQTKYPRVGGGGGDRQAQSRCQLLLGVLNWVVVIIFFFPGAVDVADAA